MTLEITHKSDISDETSSTLAQFAFGRSSNRLPNVAKTEERFHIYAQNSRCDWLKITCRNVASEGNNLKTLEIAD